MDQYQHLVVTPGPVATIALNRPEVRNAMSDVTLREIRDAFQALSKDGSLRAVVVRGEGRDFCSGGDLRWMKDVSGKSSTASARDVRLLVEMLEAVDSCPVPVVVAAQGNVFGGGLGLLAACDIALLAGDATMCFSEARLGLVPAVISRWVLPKIGAANARRYYLTAETFDAVTALRIGLVSEITPAPELFARTQKVVGHVLRCGPAAVRAAKRMIPEIEAASPIRQANLAVATLVKLRSSPEGQEGLAAFLEKRPPKWLEKP